MEDISCPVCLNEFHERDFVPKVLDCSHTFCASCVQELLNSSQECPLCRKKMERTEYPTSLMGLKWVDFYNKSIKSPTSSLSSLNCVAESEEMRVEVERRIERLNGEIENLNGSRDKFIEERKKLDEYIEGLNKKIQRKQKLSQSLKSELVKLEQLEGKWKQLDEKKEEETKKIFLELKDLCHSVDQDLLKLGDFEDEAALKREVAHRARGGDSISCFKDVKEERRYGKLTFVDGCLLGHSLSCLRGGVDLCTTLVQFENIAPSHYDGEDSFLLLQSGPDGPQIRINIRLQPLERRTSQFAHLCTGERGPSYKGAEVRDKRGVAGNWRSYFFGVDKYMEDGREGSGAIETLPASGIEGRNFEEGKVLIQGFDGGSFDMVKVKAYSIFGLIGVVGVVTSPSLSALQSFPWEKKVRVSDCGICVPF